jgi:hypothetical protein
LLDAADDALELGRRAIARKPSSVFSVAGVATRVIARAFE